MASLALAAAGGAAGGFVGGPLGAQLGFAGASLIGNIFLGPEPEDRFGPRIEDQAVSVATEGADIPIVWGRMRTAGVLIWLGALEEHEHEEDVGGKGGPSATSTTYTYTRSFAVDFGAFESQAILRLWANKELIYDVRPDADATRAPGLRMTIYLGTETQAPDPLMESVIGVGNVSAHRGHTYVVFTGLDVTHTDGRPPSIEAEVLTDADLGPESLTLSVASVDMSDQREMHWDPYNKRIYAAFVGSFTVEAVIAVADPYARTMVKVLTLTKGNRCACLPYTSLFALDNGLGRNDRLFAYSHDETRVYDTENLGVLGAYDHSGSELDWPVETRDLLAFNHSGVLKAWSKATSVLVPVAVTFDTQTLPTGYTNESPQVGFRDQTHLVKVMKKTATGELAACRFTPSTTGGASGTVYDWGELESAWDIVAMAEDTINGCLWALAYATGVDYLFKISLEGELLDTFALIELPIYNPLDGNNPLFFDAQTRSLYIHLSTTTLYIYDVVTGALTTKTLVHNSAWGVFLPDLGEIWCGDKDAQAGTVTELYADQIDRVSPNKIAAATVITDICALAGVAAANVNVALVTDELDGYKHSRRVPARSDLEPLKRALHLDSVQSDYKLKFVPRGGSVAATLDEEWMGAHSPGDTPPPAVRVTYAQGVDLPRSLELEYISVESDLQKATARAEWISGDAERQSSLSIPLVMADADAVVLADQRLQLSVEKDRYSSELTRRHGILEPTDVVSVPVGDALVRVRLLSVDRGADGIHRIAGELDDPEDLVSYAQPGAGGVTASQILLISPPQLLLLDGPLLRDVDLDHPGPYLAGYTHSAGYPGAVLFVSADATAYVQTATIASEATVGLVSNVPADVELDDWDDTNALAATMINGTLDSVTEAQVLAGANAMLYGAPGRWEVIQPAINTLTAPGAYTLSHMLRGRRGTDWAMALHQADDWLVAASDQTLRRIVVNNADIGSRRWFKLPAIGTPVADANAKGLVLGQEPLMPYAPIELGAVFSGAGVTLSWTRRTRRGGFYGGTNSLVDGVGGAVSEDTEAYETDIIQPHAPDTVVRILDSTSASVLYAAADMSTDGVPANGIILARTHQISAVAGRGHGREGYFAAGLADAIAGGLPEAYWRLEETTGTTAVDTMGNHNGTISGAVTLNKTGLVSVGTCFGFTASGDKVQTATDGIAAIGTEWTILFWIKPGAAGAVRHVFKLESASSTLLVYLYFDVSNNMIAKIRNVSGFEFGVAAGVLTASTTYAVTLIYDDPELRILVDGVEIASLAIPNFVQAVSRAVIGDFGGADLDEVALYKRVLPSAELAEILSHA